MDLDYFGWHVPILHQDPPAASPFSRHKNTGDMMFSMPRWLAGSSALFLSFVVAMAPAEEAGDPNAAMIEWTFVEDGQFLGWVPNGSPFKLSVLA